MARRKPASKTPTPASPGEGNPPDFDALLRSLMAATATTTPRRWSKVFRHLNDLRNEPSAVANPLLIPLA